MSTYTLSINITSACKEVLDSLMVTVETVTGDLASIETIEVLSPDKKVYAVSNSIDKKESITGPKQGTPTVTQRSLFLDKWMMNDSL